MAEIATHHVMPKGVTTVKSQVVPGIMTRESPLGTEETSIITFPNCFNGKIAILAAKKNVLEAQGYLAF